MSKQPRARERSPLAADCEFTPRTARSYTRTLNRVMDNMSSPSLDPRVARTRREVAQAVRQLVTERDSIAISLSDIARRAGLSRQTLYLNYPEPDAIIGKVAAHMLMRFIEDSTPGEDREQPRMPLSLLEFIRDNHAFLLPVFRDRPAGFDAHMEEFVAALWRERFDSDLDMGERFTLSYFLAGGSFTLIRRWVLMPRDQAPSPEHLAGLMEALMHRIDIPGWDFD